MQISNKIKNAYLYWILIMNHISFTTAVLIVVKNTLNDWSFKAQFNWNRLHYKYIVCAILSRMEFTSYFKSNMLSLAATCKRAVMSECEKFSAQTTLTKPLTVLQQKVLIVYVQRKT